MAFIAVSGAPGCLHEELARLAGQRFQCKLLAEVDLARMMESRFGQSERVPPRAWLPAAASILSGLAKEQHLVACFAGAEMLAVNLPGVFRFHVIAPEAIRLANLMAERGFTRSEAKTQLQRMTLAQAEDRKRRFGQKVSPVTSYDLVVNAATMDMAQTVDLLEAAVRSLGLLERGPLSAAAAAKVQFEAGLQLARYGLADAHMEREIGSEHKSFGHPSEEVFANLLDFYRIGWEYEPRSFPLQWDQDGKVSEAFTPDFYLPEFDLYVELTTMKQANVTKKNRKIRLLRGIYPHVNIQVFYQKDIQDLIMKYRLPEHLADEQTVRASKTGSK